DGLLQLQQAQDGHGDLRLVDHDEVVDGMTGELEAELADFRDGQAVGKGGPDFDARRTTGLEGGLQRRGVVRLDADDADLRAKRLDGGGDAGDQPPAADGNDDRFDVGHVFEDLQAHGA